MSTQEKRLSFASGTDSVERSPHNKFQEQANIYGQSNIIAEIDQFGLSNKSESEYLTAQGQIYLKTNSG